MKVLWNGREMGEFFFVWNGDYISCSDPRIGLTCALVFVIQNFQNGGSCGLVSWLHF